MMKWIFFTLIIGAVTINTLSLVLLDGLFQYVKGYEAVIALLDRKTIPSRGYIHLYYSIPSSIRAGQIAANLPCDDLGTPLVELVRGGATGLSPYNSIVDKLSSFGSVCMYHTDLLQEDQNTSDIAIMNPSQKSITLPDTSSVVIHVSNQGEQLDSFLSSFVDTNKKIIMHIHPRLNITLDGRPVIVPTGIGINSSLWNYHSLDEYGMQPMKMEMGASSMIIQGMAPLHTHDTSGVIHVESNQVRSYRLGQFLQNWGIDLQDKTVKLIVNGKTIQDYEGHKLTDKEHMILIIESQKT